jgi:hypothetical protein
MKSNKQRRAEIKAHRVERAAKSRGAECRKAHAAKMVV